jgi:hypothetical protein
MVSDMTYRVTWYGPNGDQNLTKDFEKQGEARAFASSVGHVHVMGKGPKVTKVMSGTPWTHRGSKPPKDVQP